MSDVQVMVSGDPSCSSRPAVSLVLGSSYLAWTAPLAPKKPTDIIVSRFGDILAEGGSYLDNAETENT